MQAVRIAPRLDSNPRLNSGERRQRGNWLCILVLTSMLIPTAPGYASDAGSPGDWLAHGRTAAEQRYSPLESINADNVATLQRRWTLDTGTTRGLEATPIVVDGVLYTTLTWSVVLALDARTGTVIWRYDPKVPKDVGRKACCDVVNRGVAVHEGRVFVGTLDGRLIALDAKDGKQLWEVVTVDQSKNYTITGAPRIVEDKVIIGNGGAEYGVRGYVSAYATKSGKQVWRTYTVPGDPSKPFESAAQEAAAKTWTGEWWKLGGGGTVWDSMAYDPKLGLLYVGTGNGSPWAQVHRSPDGGDNLYLSSILALDPSDGQIKWHYQTTPGETWDFTATQHIILADIEIEGRERKVLMQAPKNGFFYVIDRVTGEFISAEPYVNVTWATHVDESGRPVEVDRFAEHILFTQPTFFGGHNWQPMSFNPKTGLVYIPAQEILGAYRLDAAYTLTDVDFNVGTDFSVFAAFPPEVASGHLLAWDPVAQREAWRVPYGMPWNGGTLTTGGNLVFQGTADGRFLAYRADDGRTLFVDHTETGVIAAPMTFELDGVQYVSVMAGWGGAFAIGGGTAARGAAAGPGKLITYALASGAPTAEQVEAFITRPGEEADGERLYHQWCSRCHGAGGTSASMIPDLRRSVVRLGDSFELIAREGLPGTAMPKMGDSIDEAEAQLIRGFLEARAAEMH
ncbi:MAG: PQQ-dependent dehydrogenase, methanol/ethanol family [Deltaproteobacteria bacterium]|nr:PQQ-dependent dehydrogenase, methanol/ethanol family [Deltaproteobacteria bacterium]